MRIIKKIAAFYLMKLSEVKYKQQYNHIIIILSYQRSTNRMRRQIGDKRNLSPSRPAARVGHACWRTRHIAPPVHGRRYAGCPRHRRRLAGCCARVMVEGLWPTRRDAGGARHRPISIRRPLTAIMAISRARRRAYLSKQLRLKATSHRNNPCNQHHPKPEAAAQTIAPIKTLPCCAKRRNRRRREYLRRIIKHVKGSLTGGGGGTTALNRPPAKTPRIWRWKQ